MRYLLAICLVPIATTSFIAQDLDSAISFKDPSKYSEQGMLDAETNFFEVSPDVQNSTKHISSWASPDNSAFGSSSHKIQESTIEPFLNLRSKFYQDHYLIVIYSGSQPAFCYVVDDTGRTVHRYAGLLGKDPALMNIDYLPKGRYHLNVEVGGKLYQRTFYREEVINFEEDNK